MLVTLYSCFNCGFDSSCGDIKFMRSLYCQTHWTQAFTKLHVVCLFGVFFFVCFISVMSSSTHLYSDFSRFTAAQPLLSSQVGNCTAVNLNLSETAPNGVTDTWQPPVCVSHSQMCRAVKVIWESERNVIWLNYLTALKSFETIALSCC